MPLIIPGESRCPLTGKILKGSDYIVCFPHFIHDRNDALWRYSDTCMLRDAFDMWERREVFLRRWRHFERHRYSSQHWQVLLDLHDFLILWGKPEAKIRLIFLNHGFIFDVSRSRWDTLRDIFFETAQVYASKSQVQQNDALSIQVDQEGIRITALVSFPDGQSKQDRILLSQAEWVSLLEAVRTMDKEILPQLQ